MTTADLELHAVGPRDLLGHPRCTACGFIWPCPDLRNALPEQTADEMEVAALVDVGWSVWKAHPGGVGAWDDSADVGGTVVGWYERVDSDGVAHRVFRVLDFPHGRHRFAGLPADEIDVEACALPNASTLRSHSRRLAREYSDRKGTVTQYDLELLETAFTLIRCVA